MSSSSEPFSLLAISGSLRADSFNTRLLQACADLLPEGASLTVHDHHDLPLFNNDLEDAGPPASVLALREAIRHADALLISTPEYNHSISGVLKNVIDWASRPAFQGVLAGTPVGMLSASPGAVGGARAQQHLKPILLSAMAQVFPGPEVIVNHAGDKLDGAQITHDGTRDFITKYLADLITWSRHQARA